MCGVFVRVVLKSRERPPLWQSMRGGGSSDEERTARGGHVMLNAASKVVSVVDKMLLPLLDTPVGTHVRFVAVDEQAEFDLFDEVRRKRPTVLEDVETFTLHAKGLYERYMYYHACGGGA